MTMTFSGSVEDRLSIRELIGTYADAVNQRDDQLWASTWAEDSVWKLPVIPGMENIQGKENIVTAWKAAMDMFPFIFMSVSIGNIQVAGDTATVRCYTSETGKNMDGDEIRPLGQFDDQLVKIDGHWLFQERVFTILNTN